MSHYDTLGVARDASTDEIKQAYRRAAKDAHPDREGGSHERMQALNSAYAVLGDEARRAHYDATGGEELPDPEREARDLLRRLFMDAIEQEANDIVAFARAELRDTRNRADNDLIDLRRKATKLEKLRKRVNAKGENIAHEVIDAQLAQIEQGKANLEGIFQKITLMQGLVDAYECEPDPAAAASTTPQPDELLRVFLRGGFRPTF